MFSLCPVCILLVTPRPPRASSIIFLCWLMLTTVPRIYLGVEQKLI